MTPERWQAVERLYHAALAYDAERRGAFLLAECAGDDALRQEVEALLARHQRSDGFLEAPAWQSVAAALIEPATTPTVGRVIGSFEVLSRLGAGGMGVVYRARDRRLGRDVALKFLAPELTRDAEAQERLRREALAASALNHPHICTLHDVVDDAGHTVLVMEIVEGEPLSAIIPKEGLPIETVVRIGEQVADALAHAHAHGIIHRDLKPSNIVVTTDGRAKVLDFGIARHVHEADLAAVTHGERALTGTGMIAGTLPYLAPEVLKGQPADARSDIWALGVLLYQMTTGTRPFAGATSHALTGAILHEPMSPLPASIPGTLRAILQKSLAKEPSQRYQSAREVGAALEMTRQAPAAPSDVVHAQGATARRSALVRRWSPIAALVGIVAAIATWSAMRSREPAMRPVSRLTITLPGEDTLASDDPSLALSRDGRHVAYVVRRGETRQIYVRPIDRFEARALAGTDGAHMPFFSPDGRWVGFFANGKLQKVSVEGSAPVTLSDAPNGRGADWGPDDSIIFAPDGPTGLFRVSAAGGARQPVTTLEPAKGEVSHRGPQILPDGRAVVFTVFHDESPSSIDVLSFATGERRTLVEKAAHARYVPGGHLIYVSSTGGPNTVAWTVPFDLTRIAVTGVPTQLPEDFRRTMIDGFSQIAVSSDGTLAFIPGRREAFMKRSLVWVDRHGVVTPIGAAAGPYADPRLSPDGQRLVVTLVEPTGGSDIWIYELTRQTLTRLTTEGNNGYAVWSPDGTRIAFASSRLGPQNMFVRPANGSGDTEHLPAGDSDTQRPSGWSPDGRMLTFEQNIANNFRDIWVLSLESPKTSRPLVQQRGYELASRLSPDGRWLAYISDESGRFETYVTSFPNAIGKWQVSSGGGLQPVWSRNGRELFFRNADKLMVVNVDARSSFVAGQPTMLFQGRILSGMARNSNAGYDVSLDGQRFLMIQQGAEDAVNQLNVVLGWADELTRRERAAKP